MEGLIKCGLFSDLPKKELKSVEAEMKEVSRSAGEPILKKGRPGAGFMVILEGRAEVVDGEKVVNTLGPGDHFGEMALLDNGGRSMNVRAKTDIRLATIPSWSFEPFMLAHPQVTYKLAQTLSKRLRKAQA